MSFPYGKWNKHSFPCCQTTYERTQNGEALRRNHLIRDAARGIIHNMVLGGPPERPHVPDYERYGKMVNGEKKAQKKKVKQFLRNMIAIHRARKIANGVRKRKADTMSNDWNKRICVESEGLSKQKED